MRLVLALLQYNETWKADKRFVLGCKGTTAAERNWQGIQDKNWTAHQAALPPRSSSQEGSIVLNIFQCVQPLWFWQNIEERDQVCLGKPRP
jgi:hypothetical protein